MLRSTLSMTSLVGLLLVACGGQPDPGKAAMEKYGCGSCHEIPGVTGARGLVGPPLDHWGQRGIIAGHLANTPDNLASWIENPPAYSPGTAMPNLGVSDAEARQMARYLEALR